MDPLLLIVIILMLLWATGAFIIGTHLAHLLLVVVFVVLLVRVLR